LDRKLVDEEASGILNFILAGTGACMRGDIQEPAAIKNAKQAYLEEQNTVAVFIQGRTVGGKK